MEANQVTSTSAAVQAEDAPIHWRGKAARTIVQHNAESWMKPVSSRLEELVRLPFGWDGYDGMPVRLETSYFVVNMLRSICPGNMPAPQLVPGQGGDVQVEWHALHSSIELHVLRPNQVTAWRTTPELGDDGEEGSLTNDFSIIVGWIRELYQGPLIAAVAATN